MMDKNLIKQVVRFVIIGFVNTGHYYVLYLFMYLMLGVHYMVAHVLGFAISMIGSFFMNSYFTYQSRPTLKKFLQFPLTSVVNVAVTTSTLYIFTDVMRFDGRITPILASVFAIPFTFILSRRILSDKQESSLG